MLRVELTTQLSATPHPHRARLPGRRPGAGRAGHRLRRRTPQRQPGRPVRRVPVLRAQPHDGEPGVHRPAAAADRGGHAGRRHRLRRPGLGNPALPRTSPRSAGPGCWPESSAPSRSPPSPPPPCVLVGGLLSGLAAVRLAPVPHHRRARPGHRRRRSAGSWPPAATPLLCMLSIAAIAFALGLLLPRGAEALGAAIAFVVVASILNGQSALHAVAVVLPVHYWQNWPPCSPPPERPTSASESCPSSPRSPWPPPSPSWSSCAGTRRRDNDLSSVRT